MLAKRFKIVFVGLILFTSIIISALFAAGFIGNTAIRVKREHGLSLPVSASSFECQGDAWISVLDRVADSTFLMARSDLQTFTNQLKIHKPDTLFTNQSPYFLDGVTTFYCNSPTGDFLFVNISNVSESKVRIRLLTDWN